MEILRPMAAKALNITQDKVSMPYDLLVLMDITTLWENISNKWEPMIGEVSHTNIQLNNNNLTKLQEITPWQCWFGRNKTCAGKGRWTTINTVMGQCTTYITSKHSSEFTKNTNNLNFLTFQQSREQLTQSTTVECSTVTT